MPFTPCKDLIIPYACKNSRGLISGSLTPGRYVGATDTEDDDITFEEDMQRLTAELLGLFRRGGKLEAEVRVQLGRVGYGLND